MATITAISVAGMVFKTDAYVPLSTALTAIPIAFTSLETLNKKRRREEEAS